MVQIIMSILAVLASLTFPAAHAHAQTQLPDYERWSECYYGGYGYTRFYKSCWGDNPAHTLDRVREYYDARTGEKALLIWTVAEGSKEGPIMEDGVRSYRAGRLTIRLYVSEKGGWKLLETKEIMRANAPKNQQIPIFDSTSPFWNFFTAFMDEIGVRARIPSIFFTE